LRVLNSNGRQHSLPRGKNKWWLSLPRCLSNRDTARELNLSEHTIKKYLFCIFDKLGISSRVELVLYAVHHSDLRQAQWLAGMSRSIPPKLPEPFVLPASEV
jgi:DNA-binding CsgD family transcriptional regulator